MKVQYHPERLLGHGSLAPEEAVVELGQQWGGLEEMLLLEPRNLLHDPVDLPLRPGGVDHLAPNFFGCGKRSRQDCCRLPEPARGLRNQNPAVEACHADPLGQLFLLRAKGLVGEPLVYGHALEGARSILRPALLAAVLPSDRYLGHVAAVREEVGCRPLNGSPVLGGSVDPQDVVVACD